jgi:hypothetical protein
MSSTERIALNNFSYVRDGVALALMFDDFAPQDKLAAAHALLCDVVDAICAEKEIDAGRNRKLGKALGKAFDAIDALDALETQLDKAAL